jgi:hypothetical protein
MQLVGISERRYFNGRNFLGALFRKEDGTEFELPMSVDQLSVLLEEAGQIEVEAPPPPPRRRQAAAPQPSPVAPPQANFHDDFADDDEFEEVDGPTIRLAQFDSGIAEGMGDEGPLG